MRIRESFSGTLGRHSLFAAVLAVIVAGLSAPSAVAQEVMHARVSFDAGGAMVKGTADEDWSYATVNTLIMPGDTLWVDEQGTLELEMSGGSFLRMADGSKADIVSLPPTGVIKGWTGAFYVQRVARSSGSMIFQTPVADVQVENNSQVRFDILSNGATTVSVRWGTAMVRANGADAALLRTGERTYIDPGYLPSAPAAFDRGVEDTFDQWNRERARLLAVGADAVPTAVVSDASLGVTDLGTYGDWVTIDSEPYWRPTVVADYVPYRHGRWSYLPAYGYTWVGEYPFSYVTSHYGRWRHHPSYGWCWAYRPGWSPAWVASIRHGSHFVWSPLDPWNRPAAYGSDYYSVGGLRFSVYASSYVPSNYVLYGSHYVNPFTRNIVHGVPSTQINIWNININTRSPHFRAPDSRLAVRDYRPTRVIRGPQSLNHDGALARARVSTLESSAGRQRFAAVEAGQRRSVRTPVQAERRVAQARNVRLRPEAASPIPGARGRTLATSDISGIRARTRTTREAPSAPGARVSPGASPRTRTAAPSDRGRAIRSAPETRTPSATERRTVRGGTTPSPSPRSAAPETPSVRQRGETSPGAGRSTRTAPSAPSSGVRVRTGDGQQRTTVRSAPQATQPRVTAPTPSPRSAAPSRPSVRTAPSPSRVQAPRPTAPRAPAGVRAPTAPRSMPSRPSPPSAQRAPAPSPRVSAPSPRVSAPSPRVSAPSPRVGAPLPRVSAPSPRVSAPSPRVGAPSPRVSAPSGSRGASAPSIRGGSGGISTRSRGSSGGSVRGRTR